MLSDSNNINAFKMTVKDKMSGTYDKVLFNTRPAGGTVSIAGVQFSLYKKLKLYF